MGNNGGKIDDPALKALKYTLKSWGLEISDAQAVKVWGTVVILALWIMLANLFAHDTWERIQVLARHREFQHGGEPPLGFHPVISALKLCFSPENGSKGETDVQSSDPGSSKPPGQGLHGRSDLGAPPSGQKESGRVWPQL